MTTTTTIAVPTSCAALCTKLAKLAQHIDDLLAQAAGGAAIDYSALEQRGADTLGEVERGMHAQVLVRLDIDVPAIRVWGDEYRRIGRAEHRLLVKMTMFAYCGFKYEGSAALLTPGTRQIVLDATNATVVSDKRE